MDDSFLLSDGEVAEFIVKGYHLVEPELPAGLNESIADQLDALDHNPGDAITEAVPELWQVLDHPQVKGPSSFRTCWRGRTTRINGAIRWF